MNVNKQLLDAAKSLMAALNDAMPHMSTAHDGVGPDCTKQFQALVDGSAAIATAEQAQQAEPVAWHTNDPCVSGEHIEAIAKVCKIIPSYTTTENVARIVGFGHVLLADKSVQEAFVRANSHLLRTDPAQPPAVAVSEGYVLVPIEPTRGMLDAAERIDWSNSDVRGNCCNQWNAMLAAAPQAAPMSAALDDIAAERRRQVEVEGWTPEHDDAHSDGQMATAAACYAISAHNVIRYKRITMPSWWPWDSKWWKPSTTRRDLVKAGALIAAEIERIDRAAQKGGAA